jgi:DNA topoisomerase-1
VVSHEHRSDCEYQRGAYGPGVTRLRRSDCSLPGLRRRRSGRGFVYLDPSGRRVVAAEILDRIRSLAIPPAWTDVWICPLPNGHIQAMGTDARGRRQYRYHDHWRIKRDRQKFDHVLEFAPLLPSIRRACAKHLEQPAMPKERVLACAVHLLDVGFFRIGGEEYADENGSYGLATLLKRHARVVGDEVIFDYPAKSGQRRVQAIADPEIRDIVGTLKGRRGGGPELLAYRDGRRWVDVRSVDINDYLRDVSGMDVTAKDFRTWNATVLAAGILGGDQSLPSSERARRRAIRQAMESVAAYLGNTPAVCRSSYVDPRIVDLYLTGSIRPHGLPSIGETDLAVMKPSTRAQLEAAVLDLLDSPGVEVAA